MPYTGNVAGDLLTWYWQGESLEGSASDWLPITSAIAGLPFTFNIPRALIEPNINNIVKLYYSLQLASTGAYQYSKVLDLTIGKLIGELPAPQVLEAAGSTLNPMQAQTGATVRVQFASMDPQDIITLSWLGTPGVGSPPDQQAAGSASGQVDFSVPASVIGANIGQRVSVAYQVKRYVTEKQSEILLLNISTLPDSVLPTPIITQANAQTKVLNLATFAGNATTTVAAWPFIATGQRAWLRLEGETDSGGPHSIVLLDGEALTSAQVGAGLSQSVLRAALEKFGQDTALKVICNVAFSGINDEVAALPLPVMQYLFKLHHDWVTPVIVSVRDSKGEVANGGTTFDTTLDLSGTGTIDTELEILDGTTVLTTVRTDADGKWTTELTGLVPKGYSITANARDGSDLVSQPRTYEVLANLTPIIEQVLDSRGPVASGGTTVDTTVTVSGKASPDQQIELFDGNVSKGKAATDNRGAWSLAVSDLSVASHPLQAKALYGTGPVSEIWTLVVSAAVAPTISSIRDANGEVSPNGFTVDTQVTLTGAATANLEVEVFDGAATQGKATANANGIWTLPLTGLTVSRHDIKARALYGDGAESAVRSFTVVAVVNPTITAVVDPQDRPVTNGGTTYANSVTASGQASIHQLVEVFDGTTSKGTATANATGAWSRAVSGLAVGGRSLTAKALYGSNPVSSAWTFTVKDAVVPTLTSVRDSKGEVGASTTDIAVTASGKAAPSEQVEVFDGATSKGKAPVNGNGDWSHPVSGLALGAHSLKAVAQYGSSPASNVRTFQVTARFVIDPSVMTLNGRLFVPASRLDVLPHRWPAGTTSRRSPSAGTAPYTYRSSNPGIATVDAAGTVYARTNGSTAITVTDAAGGSGSYQVNVSGIIQCVGVGKPDYKGAQNAAAANGAWIPSMGELREIYDLYSGIWPQGNLQYWSRDAGGLWKNWTKNLVSGSEQQVLTFGNYIGGTVLKN